MNQPNPAFRCPQKKAARAEREGRYNVQAHENIPVAQAEVFEMPAQGGAATSSSTEVVETTAQASVRND